MKPYIDSNNPSRFYYGNNEDDWVQLTQDTIQRIIVSKFLKKDCIIIFGNLYDYIYIYGNNGDMGVTIKRPKDINL